MSSGLVTRAAIFNLAAPGANTDILGTAITPTVDCEFVITASLSTGSKVDVTITDGTDTHVITLNGNTALTANVMTRMTFPAVALERNSGNGNTLQYNFQLQTDSVVEYFVVQERQKGTAA